jgi:hypothetical protein
MDSERKTLFAEAFEDIASGDFDRVYRCLGKLGFTIRETNDSNHYYYYHASLKDDPFFRFSRNLFKPHGKKRDNDRMSNRDKSQAKQVVEALREQEMSEE